MEIERPLVLEPIVETQDVMQDQFFKLYPVSEKQMWKMSDIPWNDIQKDLVPPALLRLVREIVFAELTTFTATKHFMELFENDIDFTHWLSIWFYEETKHPHVLMKWLSHFGEKFDTQFMAAGRKIHPMRQNRMEMLCMNIVSEVTAANEYNVLITDTEEPVLKLISRLLSVDETRHATGFFTYAKKLMSQAEDQKPLQLTALRVLFYCLYSMEQHHPVNEFIKRIRQDKDLEKQVGAGLDDPNVQRMLIHKFGQLTGLSFSSKEEIVAHIQELRSVTGEI
jgi:hypothetical protein